MVARPPARWLRDPRAIIARVLKTCGKLPHILAMLRSTRSTLETERDSIEILAKFERFTHVRRVYTLESVCCFTT